MLLRIAEPCSDTRAVVPPAAAVVAVRARTPRVDVVVLTRGALTVRAVTPRDGAAVDDAVVAVVPRDTIVRLAPGVRDPVAVTRDVPVARDTVDVAPPAGVMTDGAVAVRAAVVRVDVDRLLVPRVAVVLPRGLARETARDVVPVRAVWGAATGIISTGTGSANTARMDTRVEHTKNAAANKKTVPMAFLQ